MKKKLCISIKSNSSASNGVKKCRPEMQIIVTVYLSKVNQKTKIPYVTV
jgi:hypothetical protein